jgi:hypothetical protein
MNIPQICQSVNGHYINYYLKHGQPVQCTNIITETVNGVETKRQCGVYLTNYGDRRSTDRSSNGSLHCLGCHRLYNKEKQRIIRNKVKQVTAIETQQQTYTPQNFNGMMAPGYGNQFIPNIVTDNLSQLHVSDSDGDDEIELLRSQNESQVKEIEILRKEIETLKENLEAIIIKIVDDQSKFESKVELRVIQIMKEKEKYIMDTVSKYVSDKCQLKPTIF